MIKNIIAILLIILFSQCKMSYKLPYSKAELNSVIKKSMIIPISGSKEMKYQAPLVALCIAIEEPVEPGQIIIDTCIYYQKFKVQEIISGKPDSIFTCHYEINIENEETLKNNKEYILLLQDTKAEKNYNLLKAFKDNPENRQIIKNAIIKNKLEIDKK